MKNLILIILFLSIMQGCATTNVTQRLPLPVVSLDKGEEFWCSSGGSSYFLGKDKVVVADLSGKKHDKMGVIVGIEKELMKDGSFNYSIRFATRDLFSQGKVTEYSYAIDYIRFNSEIKSNGFMSNGEYIVNVIYFPSVPKTHSVDIRRKAYCKVVEDGYMLMTNAEYEMGFNDEEAF